MDTVEKLLKNKSRDIWSIGFDDSVYDAIALMSEKNVGALPVLKSGKLTGIVSERDYARKVVLQNRSSKETRVADIMTSKVRHVSPDQSIDECMALMSKHHFRHLPVVENGDLKGIISINDVVKDIINAQQSQINDLEKSISWAESY